MPDELRELDDIEVPNVRYRIGMPTRFEGVGVGSTSRPRARLATAAVALVVFVGAVFFAWRAFAPSHSTSPGGDAGVFIAVDPQSQPMVMDALLRSPLVVRNGCVLVGNDSDLTLPIWPRGFTAGLDDSGRVEIRDAEGQVVAIEGQAFDMGGGYVAEFQPANKVEPKEEQVASVESGLGYQLPAGCLSGIYGIWQVGETTPLDQAAPPPSATGSGGPDRAAVYEALVRFIVTSPDTEGDFRDTIHVDPTLCSIDEPNCDDRLTDEEEQSLVLNLADLGTVVFGDNFDPEDGSSKVLLGPVSATADGIRVEGGSICGGLCGSGGTYAVESTTSGDGGYVVTGLDDSYAQWIA